MTAQEATRLLRLMEELADNAKWLIRENERLQAENVRLWRQVLNAEALVWDRTAGRTPC
jgi:regulator of replication initiation timing